MDNTDFIIFAQQMLLGIETGKLQIHRAEPIEKGYAGIAGYKVSNGWTLRIFIDCGSFDYVDSIVSPDGEVYDPWGVSKGRQPLRELQHYSPSRLVAKKIYGTHE